MTGIEAVALYAGINLILLIALAMFVINNRRNKKISLSDGGDAQMLAAIRGHGNAVEWIPIFMLGLALLAMINAPLVLIHAFGIIFTAARALHGYAFMQGGSASPARFYGMLTTLLVALALALSLIWLALT